jgi:serine/threonine protein kinase
MLPRVTDYVHTLENPHGVFRTLGEVSVERNVYGEVELHSGNNSVIFTYTRGGAKRFLKCYTRPNPYLREIYSYIEKMRPRLLPRVRLLAGELYVTTLSGETAWVDIVEGEWTNGETLDRAIARAAKSGNTEKLGELARGFDEMCAELLAEEWAHGDLKPENIVVSADGAMTLIDCDAMWIPAFADHRRACELGTPAYRHPERDESWFDKHIDDYSVKLISTYLHALALDPSLWTRYDTGELFQLVMSENPEINSL